MFSKDLIDNSSFEAGFEAGFAKDFLVKLIWWSHGIRAL